MAAQGQNGGFYSVNTRIQGLSQLQRRMNRIDREMTTRGMKEIHRKIGGVVVAGARTGVPRRSGRLASTMRTGAQKSRTVVRAGRASVPYAGPIHWGWPNRPNRAKGWRGGSIDAHPWLSEAAQRTEPVWVSVYERELRSLVERTPGL
jgi:hypothetical protein